jgi:PAS domain S-box-containing protein
MAPPPPPNDVPFDFYILVAAMLISATVLLIAAFYIRHQKASRATKPFQATLILCAVWSFLAAMILVVQDQGLKISLLQVECLVIIFIPVALLVTILAYLGRTSMLRPRYYALLLVTPLISVVMLLTNDYHDLFFSTYEFSSQNDMVTLVSNPGPYFSVHILYLYALVLLTMALLVHHMFTMEGSYRKRDILILTGIALPFLGDMVSILGASPGPGLSWAPVLFMTMGIMLLFALYKYHAFDLMPLARGLVWKNTPDPLFILDGRGQIVDVNGAACKLVGRSPEDVVGTTMADATSFETLLWDQFKGPISTAMEISVNKDGVRKDFEIINTSIVGRGERSLGTLVLFRDITLQKALQEETRQSELKYRLLLENTPFPIAVATVRDGSILFINGNMEKLLKGSRADILDKNVGTFFAAKDDISTLMAELNDEKWIDNYETPMLDARGERFWAYLSATPIILNNEPMMIMAISDISDRKMAEALKTANKKLNLLYGITRHDLLNKFTAISGYLSLLEQTEDRATHHQIIAKIDKSAQAAQELIRFTHDYEDLGVTAPVWQSVSEVIRRAGSRLDLTGVDMSENVGPLKVYADSMLDKVFYNLMENSLRHGERVTALRIHTEDLPDSSMNIVYEDDGAGIVNEDKKFLFQQGRGKHTGQGMFLTREILHITGLTITEDGEPGKGVRFRIHVPRDMRG